MKNTNTQKEIQSLFKKLDIKPNKKANEKKLFDYKLQSKFPTKYLNGTLTISNYTK